MAQSENGTVNPPYLPASEAGSDGGWPEQARSGGASGREVIERFTAGSRVLTADGCVLLLASNYTGIEAVAVAARTEGFTARTAADQSFPSETLTVLQLRHESELASE